jgi:hypothetical protein
MRGTGGWSSKAARCRIAAGRAQLIDFSARRTHGRQAALAAARAAAIAGFAATSNVEAAQRYRLTAAGTMAHSFVEAFTAFATDFPAGAVFLVDTYDTPNGVRTAIDVARQLRLPSPVGIRLDSGDLGATAKNARHLLDEAGLRSTRIVASGGLDEYAIAARVPVDAYGVGTKMGVSALDSAYPLVSYGVRPVMKLSPGKVILPGPKQVFRPVTGRVPPVSGPEFRAVPARLVAELPDELAEPGVGDGACEPAVADHPCDVKRLDRDGALGSREPGRELVQEVAAPVGDGEVDVSEPTSGLVAVVAALDGAGQGLVRPAELALRGLERARGLDFFDLPGVVHDHGERGESEVDAAGRCVRTDRAGGVDIGAVDVELERRPPSAGLFAYGRRDDPGTAVAEAFGQPGQVLAGGDLTGYAGQPYRGGPGGVGPVGVVPEPGAVLALAELREADLAAFAFAGLRLPPVFDPAARSRHASFGTRDDRPDSANHGATSGCSDRHSFSRSIPVHVARVSWSAGTPADCSAARAANASRILSRA